MALQKLPIGIQTFSKIREDNYIYIDKTEIAYEIIQNYQYVFLSRPRRFGKSLFLDTLKNIFEGNREYFNGLAIEPKWDWSVKYPVIKIAFGKVRNSEDLKQAIEKILHSNQEKLGVICSKDYDYANCFSELIEKVFSKYNQKVVILIDEYDKPILDNVDQLEVAVENREILSRFYTEIKNADAFIRFAMLTGVSKFSKASIFSGLNMLTDISLDDPYGDICGYAQHDIETTFAPYLKDVDMKKFKNWYNGYNFLKSDMYNPFDVLQFIAKGKKYKNYWFETGTPTFLIKLIEKNNYFLPKLSNLVVGEQLLGSFDIENLDLEVVLFQSGYLTIEKQVEKRRGGFEYHLKVPNLEVKTSLYDVIAEHLTNNSTQKIQTQDSIYDALEDKNLEDFKTSLISLFSAIPYNNYTKSKLHQYEGFYASVIFVYLQSLGLNIIGEDVTNTGRIDLTIKMANAIYILEFKVDGKNALAQIKEKNYAQKYMREKKEIYLVGIEFDTDKRNVSKFEWERV